MFAAETGLRILPPSGHGVPASGGDATLGPQAARAQPPNRHLLPSGHCPHSPRGPQPQQGAKWGAGPARRAGAPRPLTPRQPRAHTRSGGTPRAAHRALCPARRRRQQQLREAQRPDSRGTQPRLPGPCLPFYPHPAVPGLAVSAAHGAGSGGGNVNKSGFYSYLTLECRVHLLSARYQTPAALNRVFTKAGCANCVAETRASDTTLR